MTEATKTFLAIYLGSPAAMEAWRTKPEAERKDLQAKGMVAWKRLGGQAQGRDRQPAARRSARPSASPPAASPTSATRWPPTRSSAPTRTRPPRLCSSDHPHFMMFPGEAIEVMECLAIPGM